MVVKMMMSMNSVPYGASGALFHASPRNEPQVWKLCQRRCSFTWTPLVLHILYQNAPRGLIILYFNKPLWNSELYRWVVIPKPHLKAGSLRNWFWRSWGEARQVEREYSCLCAKIGHSHHEPIKSIVFVLFESLWWTVPVAGEGHIWEWPHTLKFTVMPEKSSIKAIL